MRQLFPLLLLLSAVRVMGQSVGADTVPPASKVRMEVISGPRRWRGTVGRQSVTLELDSNRWGYSGQYFYDRRGQSLALSGEYPKPHQPLVIQEREPRLYKATGSFTVNGPVGRQLTGTWRSADGRQAVPFALVETYAGAARYEVETWYLTRYAVHHQENERQVDSATLSQDYLRLRLPENPAAEHRLLRALAAPVAAPRMPQHLDSLLTLGQPTDQGSYAIYNTQYVVSNGGQLLAVVQGTRFWDDTLLTTREWSDSRTFDLRTGRQLRLTDLLVPGYQARLRLLRRHQLERVWEDNPAYDGIGQNDRLPAGGFLATPTGLRFSYDDRDAEKLAFPGPYHADREVTVEVSYEQLLPLIRLDGPLAPLLQLRGLLPKK